MSDHDDKPPHRVPVPRRHRGGQVTGREAQEIVRNWLEKWKGHVPERHQAETAQPYTTTPGLCDREPGEDDPEAA